ncbi:helix-turn-helix domain-containing protein [Amycolatopsis sp. NPDC049868]|uniref:nSTAND1 domain-containing NTPase n=1 Tax=Amycolatopsis sp. NPDC049868 TaxID=3363934 RepID=UPI0037A86E09
MPRAERPLDDDGSVLSEFASDLRALRRRAGSLTYRDLARQAHFSSTTLSDAAGGRQLPSLAVTLAYVRACGGDADQWEKRWHAVAAELTTQRPARDDDAEAPYVGLAAYSEADAARFFGRERLIADLDHRITRQRFLAVFGPSGSGKSSVLRAGLVPRLVNANTGLVVAFHPGARPLEELAVHLSDHLDIDAGAVASELGSGGPEALRSVSDRILRDRPGAREIVLVIDQFEEVFTLCDNQDERGLFVTLLADAAQGDGPLRVVLGVRADFYNHCAQNPQLAAALQDTLVTVGPMTVDELRHAITKPAVNANCTIETALLATLIAQAQGQAGVLPLLSHALLETWRHRKGHTLTLAGFHNAGGIAGALANTAESVFTDFTDSQQAVAAQLFRRLTAVGEGTDDTKRRINLDELDDNQDTRSVLAALVSARLIMLSQDTVEITHEALIKAWPRLADWLQEDRDGQRLHRMLSDAAATWTAHNKESGSLLRGARLAMVSNQTVRSIGLSMREREFLDASVAASEHEKQVARRRSRRQQQLIALLATLLVLSVAATIYAVDSRRTATQQRNIALALGATRAAAEIRAGNPSLAAQISLAAFQMHPSQEAQDGLIAAAAEATRSPLGKEAGRVLLSPNGDLILRINRSGEASIWSVENDRITLRGKLYGAYMGAEISANGRLMVTVDGGGQMRLWDTSDLNNPRLTASLPGLAAGGTISPGGKKLIVAGAVSNDVPEGVDAPPISVSPSLIAHLWNIERPGKPMIDDKATLNGCGFTFDFNERYIVGNSCEARPKDDGTENRVYPLAAGIIGPSRTFGVVGRQMFQPIISNDGAILAGVADARIGKDILLWDMKDFMNPKLTGSIPSAASEFTTTALGSTGTKLASAGMATMQAWEISDVKNPRRLLDAPKMRARYDSVKFAQGDQVIVGIGTMESTGESFYWRWRLDPVLAAKDACSRSVKIITESEWSEYFPGVDYRPPCK